VGHGERVALVLILAAAAVLRFAGIAHHLAADPFDFDETNNFIEPIGRMWRSGSADPTVYSGYPGLFNWLAFLPVGLGRRLSVHTGAYVAARAVVATFGVLNVLLLHRLSRKAVGAGAALFAACLLAFSRGDVQSAHSIAPDVLVTTGTLLVLLVLAARPSGGQWALAGTVAGITTAVKYTGLLTVVPLLVGCGMGPQRRSRLPVLALFGILAFTLAAPYAVMAVASQGMGMGFLHSIKHYYGQSAGQSRALQGQGLALGSVVGNLTQNVGPLGMLLAAASPLLFRPLRLILPTASVVLATLIVMAPANMVYPRHVLPATAALALLSAAGLSGLARVLGPPRRGTLVAVALGGLAVLLPLRSSMTLALRFLQPTAGERAIAWLEETVTGPALVGSLLTRFPADDQRFEVRLFDSLHELPGAALGHFDFLVAGPGTAGPLPGLGVVQRFCESRSPPDCEVTVFRPTAPFARLPAPLPSTVTASTYPERARAAFDSDAATIWPGVAGASWLEARWPLALTVARIDVDVDGSASSWPQELHFEGLAEDGTAGPIEVFPLRPVRPARQRRSGPHGQAYVLVPPTTVHGLRLRRGAGPVWGLAEVHVFLAGPPEPLARVRPRERGGA